MQCDSDHKELTIESDSDHEEHWTLQCDSDHNEPKISKWQSLLGTLKPAVWQWP